jgi:hypothetical protein
MRSEDMADIRMWRAFVEAEHQTQVMRVNDVASGHELTQLLQQLLGLVTAWGPLNAQPAFSLQSTCSPL